ncbi:MAG: extracellular solute-binding protein [Candidatus Tectomicrobia bacterium]|nr:extracellular solute-binding protein [Candidatus Tectomicrobia bacterium]
MNKDQLTEQLATGKMSRREFNKLLGSVGVTMAAFPVMSGVANAATEDHPMIFTWEGWEDQGLHQPYSTKYGESPNFTFFGDEEEAFAKMRAGFKPDITQPCSYKVPIWRDAGIIKPIDPSRLSNWNDVLPSLKEITGMVHDGQRYFIPADWGQTAVLYREDLVDMKEESWGLMWDERYKGRLSMSDSLIDGVMVAAIYGGAKDPFNMTEEEVAKTKDLLKQQLPLMRYYWSSVTDIQQSLASGELVAAVAWNDSYTALKSEGVPVKFMKPKEGAMTWVCGFCLMTDADPKKIDRAYDYIDAYISPESGAWEIRQLGYGCANAKAFDLVSAEELADRGLSSNPDDMLNAGIFQEPMGNEPALQAMFEEVKAGL